MTIRRCGIWGGNGRNPDADKMLSFQPSAVTTRYEDIATNKVLEYKRANPDAIIVVRFMHPTNWRDELDVSAYNWGTEIAGKWNTDPVLRELDPYIYIANEQNLWYESGGASESEQWSYFDTEDFYKTLGEWWYKTHKLIKELAPDIKLISPPLAYGHNEDGVFKNGQPSIGWAGYDYLQATIKEFCDGNMCAHFYWGNSEGDNPGWLYGTQDDPELHLWHAFRWKKVLELFETRYGWTPKIMIDEAGNFNTAGVDFTEQLQYYSKNTLNHPDILGVTYFLWYCAYNSDGNRLNDWLRYCPDIDRHLEVMKNTIVEIEDEDTGGGEVTVPYLSFAESSDVLDVNLEKHTVDGNNKVTGSVVRIIPVDVAESRMGHAGLNVGDTYYKVKTVYFINEQAAQNGTGTFVTILGKDGSKKTPGYLFHGWPTDRMNGSSWPNSTWDETLHFTYPTGEGKVDGGTFAAEVGSEKVGPYFFAVDGVPSEWAVGFGLPNNRHVQYGIVFIEAVWGENDDGNPTDPDEPTDPVEPTDPDDIYDIIDSNVSVNIEALIAVTNAGILMATKKITEETYLEVIRIALTDDCSDKDGTQ